MQRSIYSSCKHLHSATEKYLRFTYNDQTNVITTVCQNNDDKNVPVCIGKVGSHYVKKHGL